MFVEENIKKKIYKMGIFIKFTDDPECNWCGNKVYNCTCGRDANYNKPHYEMTGDIICKKYDDGNGNIVDEFYVTRKIDNKIYGIFLRKGNGEEVEWQGDYMKVCSVIRESEIKQAE